MHFAGKRCRAEFNSTYPSQLEAIIEQTEFAESIENINRAISKRDSFIMLEWLPETCSLIGIILTLAGVVIVLRYILLFIPLLIGVGCCILAFGLVIVVFGFCMIRADLSNQLQQTIARESAKYSTRTPTPCRWQLDTRRIRASTSDNYRVSDIALFNNRL